MSDVNLWGHFVSRLSGEVPADVIDAYRRASLSVYEMLDHVEQKRLDIKLAGHHPWAAPPATQAEILCAWNAYALQLLGDYFVDADYRLNPATQGYLPPITADQVLVFYEQVEPWMNRARQAHSNPNYRLDVAVPADMPPWSEVEPCPNAHLHGMMEAMRALRDHASLAMAFFEETTSPEEKQDAIRHARQLWAAAHTKSEYADRLWEGNPSEDLHERIEDHVKEAVERLYRLGQMLAMPDLLEEDRKLSQSRPVLRPLPTAVVGPPVHGLPGPGEIGFDPWCLTDSDRRTRLQGDPEARVAIGRLWKMDPDPQRTLAILAEIRAAFARGDIGYAMHPDGRRIGHFFCCPWSPVYVALRSCVIGGTEIRTLQQFVYDVNCEAMNLGRPFTRKITVARFASTDELEYGDPDEAPDH
ncbi:MAG: hypothetical protein SFU56_15440 [Capsulimonadales bacterium]|nr:hypothetical protein [Capsulimonadales bacterium]